MKIEIQGRVVSHSIFAPNPKDDPDFEVVKIGIVLSAADPKVGKFTKAVLIVPQERAWEDLVLRRMVRIVLQDSQQDAFLPPTSEHGEKKSSGNGTDEIPLGEDLDVTLSTTNPETGEVKEVKTSTRRMARATSILSASKGRRTTSSRAH
jgi:hypothetical protein